MLKIAVSRVSKYLIKEVFFLIEIIIMIKITILRMTLAVRSHTALGDKISDIISNLVYLLILITILANNKF